MVTPPPPVFSGSFTLTLLCFSHEGGIFFPASHFWSVFSRVNRRRNPSLLSRQSPQGFRTFILGYPLVPLCFFFSMIPNFFMGLPLCFPVGSPVRPKTGYPVSKTVLFFPTYRNPSLLLFFYPFRCTIPAGCAPPFSSPSLGGGECVGAVRSHVTSMLLAELRMPRCHCPVLQNPFLLYFR